MVIHYYPAQAQRGRTQPAVPKTGVAWRGLYALLPMAGLLLLGERRLAVALSLNRVGHMALQCAVILTIYGVLAWWLRDHQAALREQREQNTRSQRRG